jgi:hypothetical protein
MSLHGRSHWWALAVAVALAGCADFEPEKLRCEEAMAKIMACCPGLPRSPMVCEYQTVTTGYFPSFRFPNVECLIDPSCAELAARGVCTWALDPAAAPAVCP